MKSVTFESDYAPGPTLQIVQTDDGDIILKVRGSGEMRIATSGGKLRGRKLVECVEGFSKIITALEKDDEKYDEAKLLVEAVFGE